MDYKVKQIWPNHADHISYYKNSFIDEMLENDDVIIQPKYDGERMLMHFDNNDVYCTSRRISKKTGRFNENQDTLPKFKELKLYNVGYTVLDGECYADSWSEVVGVLHSLPERAKELQKTVNVRYAVFDCLWFNGEDLTDKPYHTRLKYAKMVVDMLKDESIHYAKQFVIMSDNLCLSESFAQTKWHRLELEDIMNKSIELGFEGIVVKSLEKSYYAKAASLKVKKFETLDVVIYGYIQGRGKYSNTVGALRAGYYNEATKKVEYICNVNCGTDADREMWKAHFSKFNRDASDNESYFGFENCPEAWKVLEVKTQEVTSKSLRHPVYIRVREDKSYSMCTKETIFKE